MVEIETRPGGPTSTRLGVSDEAEAAEKTERPADLADAIVWLARWHGLSPRRGDIVHALPAGERGPVLAYLEDMGRRAGLDLKVENAPPHRISPVTPPVAVFREAGGMAIITRIDTDAGEAVLVDPLRGEETGTVMTLDALGALLKPAVIYAVPAKTAKAAPAGVAAEAPPPAKGEMTAAGSDWFWSAVRRFWPNYVQVIVAALLINILGLASPLFIRIVYDRVIPNLAIPTLWALTAGVAIALVFDIVLKLLRARIVDETGRRVDMAVAGRLFDKLIGIKLAGRPESGGAFASRMRDFDTVRDVLTSSSVVAITDLAFIGVFLWVMWLLVGPLVLVPTLVVPIVLGLTLAIQIPLAAAQRESQADSAMRQGILAEALNGLEALKAAGAEGWVRRSWDHAVAASSRTSARSRFWATLAVTLVATANQLTSIVIIVWGVFLVISGDITVGALIAASILTGRVLAPLASIAQTLTRLVQARGALTVLNRLMAQPSETASSSTLATGGGIAFRGVTFSYPKAAGPALADVSFAIAPGEVVGIIGRVGSGKSTIGRLMAGLYEAGDGQVLLDGRDIRQIGVADLRETVGYCAQEPYLFTGTLRANIVMGRPFASEADLERAVRLSGVAAFAGEHPNGLDMPVAEGGRSLSGGQRQAVALARILLRRPSVLFLDEPSASLDARSELALMAGLREIADEGVTLLIATHRDRLLDIASRLLVFDKGRLMADGPKEGVMTKLRAMATENRNAAD
ncbi:MAG: type I secretion system permease/ATPase [Rhodobiaceae bacterium]|nr:type I secretion system permease/ATPase [Rhodobiaceae bacterium]